jgi:hypothetical protein
MHPLTANTVSRVLGRPQKAGVPSCITRISLALAETRSELRPVPSYTTVRRFLAAHGLTKRRPMTTRQTEGALAAAARLEAREVRSYESEYSGKRVVSPVDGQQLRPGSFRGKCSVRSFPLVAA